MSIIILQDVVIYKFSTSTLPTGFCKFETEIEVLLLQAQKLYTRISAVACEHVSGKKY
jgi:hypothetical protein